MYAMLNVTSGTIFNIILQTGIVCLKRRSKMIISLVVAMSVGNIYHDIAPYRWVRQNRMKAMEVVLVGNIVIGCLEVGIGQAFNHGSFVEGCLKGMATGSMAFVGEMWAVRGGKGAGKFVFDSASSIQENLMTGRDAWSRFRTDVGPVALTFDKSLIPSASFGIYSTLGLVFAASKRRFDAKNSLAYLTPVFYYRKDLSSTEHVVATIGGSIGNVVSYRKGFFTADRIITHEMIHVLQFRRFMSCNDVPLPWVNGKYIAFGRDICTASAFFQSNTNNLHGYFRSPFELEAYTMEKD